VARGYGDGFRIDVEDPWPCRTRRGRIFRLSTRDRVVDRRGASQWLRGLCRGDVSASPAAPGSVRSGRRTETRHRGFEAGQDPSSFTEIVVHDAAGIAGLARCFFPEMRPAHRLVCELLRPLGLRERAAGCSRSACCCCWRAARSGALPENRCRYVAGGRYRGRRALADRGRGNRASAPALPDAITIRRGRRAEQRSRRTFSGALNQSLAAIGIDLQAVARHLRSALPM
jgi:hypothetical protein